MERTYYQSTDIRPTGAWYAVTLETQEHGKPACIDVHKLAETLPHGSGIDGNWTIQVKRNGDVVVYGEYHAMNESGYYVGWRNFRFTIARAVKTEYHALTGPCAGKYQATRVKGCVYLKSFVGGGDASDYLYDTIAYSLSEHMGIHAIDSYMFDSETAAKNAVSTGVY